MRGGVVFAVRCTGMLVRLKVTSLNQKLRHREKLTRGEESRVPSAGHFSPDERLLMR